ncbi:uncharacterized protein LOC131679886 [Topomyia yanbarensis]|uniref:uncharacterized protein LOC131679886 n=1 Tax=Topomyia yanbarensis TaxID=2498891 RepID=UPI00273B1CF4|nr:uncharacterized protein LOC131679886 [Topomyia yanbarensis]
MELLYRSQETRAFFKKLNDSRNGFVPQAEMGRDKEGGILTDERKVVKRLRQYCNEHLNGVKAVNRAFKEDDYVSVAADGDVPAPTMNEVNEAIQQLKNNKAKDGLGTELFEVGPEKLRERMHRIIERIWDRE